MNKLLLAAFILCPFISHSQVKNEEDWSRKPPHVNPSENQKPPSDAVVLFDGSDLSAWTSLDGGEAAWTVREGVLMVEPGTKDIITKQKFGDVQLHIEWMIPEEDHGHGNSGVYFQKRYEVQIYNSYQDADTIYYNGQTGSIYKQHIPLVNAHRPRGHWESFDIVFFAPRFDDDGTVISDARFTVFHNGILVHHNVELKGSTTHEPFTRYESHSLKEPLLLQDHGDRVMYRNIWVREL